MATGFDTGGGPVPDNQGKKTMKEMIPLNASLIERIRAIHQDRSFQVRVPVEKQRIFTPDGSDGAWYYSHHPFITKFKGKLYAVWSSGRINEDDVGQRVMLATSENFTDWKVGVLVDSIRGENTELTLYATGLYTDGETLTVYYTAYEYTADTLRKNPDGSDLRPEEKFCKRVRHSPRYLQTTDGVHWSIPKPVSGNFTCGEIYCGNLSPVRLPSGKLFWPGYGSFAISENGDPTGSWQGRFLPLAEEEEKTRSITESGVLVHEDGTLFLLSRTDGGTSVCAASADDGKTWTDFYHTQITDHGAKFEIGRLPDGRYYLLANADNRRTSVNLFVSRDGCSFDKWYLLADEDYRQMKEGMYKGGVYGYPTSCIDDNYLYCIYSLRKESVELLRVDLSEISR